MVLVDLDGEIREECGDAPYGLFEMLTGCWRDSSTLMEKGNLKINQALRKRIGGHYILFCFDVAQPNARP